MTVTGAVKSLFECLVQSGTDEVDETLETIRVKVHVVILLIIIIVITTEPFVIIDPWYSCRAW